VANREQTEDERLLIEMLVTIEKRLYIIVFGQARKPALS